MSKPSNISRREAISVAPDFLRLILAFGIDGFGIPVVLLTLNVIAALQQQDALSGWRQFVSQCAASRTRADNDNIVVAPVRHGFLLQTSRQSEFNDSIAQQGGNPSPVSHSGLRLLTSDFSLLVTAPEDAAFVVLVMQLGANDSPGSFEQKVDLGRQKHS